MPDIWMDVDIAIAEAPVNILPLIDDTDFKSIEAAVTFDQAGMDLFWHFVTTAGVQTQTAVTPTTAGVHDWTDQGASGMYALEIPASAGTINNDTEGFGWFSGFATGVLPWRGPVIGFRAATLNATFIDDEAALITAADVGLMYESVITTAEVDERILNMATAFPEDDMLIGCVASLEDKSANIFYAGNIWIADSANTGEIITLNAVFPVAIEDGVDVLRIYAEQHATFAAIQHGAATSTELNQTEVDILADALINVQVLARSDAANATNNANKITDINENGGGGGGDYDPTVEALQGVGDRLPTALSASGNMRADILEVNNVTLQGIGTVANPWRPV